ncbi:Sphingosine kinase 1 [Pleurostoma richardsiae]|uniref:Sphingosine kinase 1 n=1 Tax=Pleurostoma richardsiae TaxID=41990 RepID=A0AA38R6A5_9PEZI|nr:Sphingosine kinase 1 [Pleurostoma richardsiae]
MDQQAQLPHEPHLIKYADGELTWSATGESDEPAGRAKDEDVVCILPTAEQQGGGYRIVILKQGSQEDDAPFQLSTVSAKGISQELLDRHLLKEPPLHLRVNGSAGLEIHVIVSVGSGTRLAEQFYDSALRPLLELLELQDTDSPTDTTAPPAVAARQTYKLVKTKDANTIREFAAQRWGADPAIPSSSIPSRSQTIILLSGDGGIVDLLNGSSTPTAPGASHPTIALLPLGTGNALFHSLHKPLYATAPTPSPFVLGLRTLLTGAPAPLPTFRASFSPGSSLISYSAAPAAAAAAVSGDAAAAGLQERHDPVDALLGGIVASYGFHAQLVWESDTPEYRRHGAKRFGMVAQELLGESHAYKARVAVRRRRGGASPSGEDGAGKTGAAEEEEEEEVFARKRFAYILATLVSNLERAFTISPASRPLDGQLRLVHFGAVGGERTMDIMKAAYDEGKHVEMRWTTTGDEGKEVEDRVGYDAVEEVRVTVLEEDVRWRKVCVDGTIVEIPQGGSMTVRKVEQPRFKVVVDGSVL